MPTELPDKPCIDILRQEAQRSNRAPEYNVPPF